MSRPRRDVGAARHAPRPNSSAARRRRHADDARRSRPRRALKLDDRPRDLHRVGRRAGRARRVGVARDADGRGAEDRRPYDRGIRRHARGRGTASSDTRGARDGKSRAFPKADEPIALEYVTVVAAPRARSTLRRLLDEIDPASALVFAREAESTAAVRRSASLARLRRRRRRALSPRPPLPGPTLVVLYDLPATREELREAVAGAARRIALIQPRQLDEPSRALARRRAQAASPARGGRGVARRATRACSRELRALLESGAAFGRELLSLEPLLDDYDGAEIAAAALKLLEQRTAAERAAPPRRNVRRRASARLMRLARRRRGADGPPVRQRRHARRRASRGPDRR